MSSTGRDPATTEARSGYAAHRARTGASDLIAWPSPRNAPCWCGIGRKYKNAAAIPAPAKPPRTD
ncbi:MAG: SEC-C metal-binding domain-containing protein [Pseudonocardiaceae bacterium]